MVTTSVLSVAGYEEALYGVGLSRGLTSRVSFEEFEKNIELTRRLHNVALSLAPKNGGHNKFLESIMVWLSVDAPRYWWSQFDTYRHCTKQSESTMYSLQSLLEDNSGLEDRFDLLSKDEVENLKKKLVYSDIDVLKSSLPEGFIQRRQICLSLMTLKNIYLQRQHHRLQGWREFVRDVKTEITYLSPEISQLLMASVGQHG